MSVKKNFENWENWICTSDWKYTTSVSCFWRFCFKKESGEYEPDNWSGDDASGEDCACLGYENMYIYLNYWFDASCKYKKKYICEKTFSSTLTDDN